MYKEKKLSRKPNMSRKGKCTREYLYTALRVFAADAPEKKKKSTQESGNNLNCTRREGGGMHLDYHDLPPPAEKGTRKYLQYTSFP